MLQPRRRPTLRESLAQLYAIFRTIRKAGLATFYLGALSLSLQAIVLISPFYLQLAIDEAVAKASGTELSTLAIGFGLLLCLSAAVAYLRLAILLELGTALGVTITSQVSRSLLRLPLGWFKQHNVGDALSRFQSAMQVRYMLTEEAPAALIDGPLAIFTLGIMIIYSPLLTVIALSAIGLYVSAKIVSYRRQMRAQSALIEASSQEQATIVESARGALLIRLYGLEEIRHALWNRSMRGTVENTYRLRQQVNLQQVIRDVLIGAENILSVWIAANLAIQHRFTVGMVFSFLAYKVQFTTAAVSLVDKTIALKLLGTHLGRVDEITQQEVGTGRGRRTLERDNFSGRVELKNVSFRYESSDTDILRDVNMVVEPGRSIAITGPSGGGKSTLLYLILGILKPTSGSILVEGVPLDQVEMASFYRNIACITQEDTLFSGSLGQNIAMFETRLDQYRVRMAADAAGIGAEISRMPHGFETRVGDTGDTLSGGQRQRVFLARALYRQPKMIISDEGTSQLDEPKEREIVDYLQSLKITRLSVAHRRQTIDGSDVVYQLEGGNLTRLR